MSQALSTDRRLASAAVLVGMFASALESSIGTALPRMVGTLGDSDHLSWIMSIFLLASAVGAVILGRLADEYGRKRTYLAGMGGFLIGSIAAASAPNMLGLLIARALQGLGAGALTTVSLTIIGDLYSPAQRARLQALFVAVWGSASAAGPVLGGALADHVHWRWVFVMGCPFGLTAMVALSRSLYERVTARQRPLDVRGAALLVSMVLAFQLAGTGRSLPTGIPPWACGLAGIALGIALIAVERRVAAPILPLPLLKARFVATALLVAFFSGAAMFGALSYAPLFLQTSIGASATEAGALTMPLSVAWSIGGMVSGILMARAPAARLVNAGMSLLVCGAALLVWGTWHAPRQIYPLASLLTGLGMGMGSTPLLVSLQTRVDWAERGAITAALAFARSTGGMFGTGAAGAIAIAMLDAHGISSNSVDAAIARVGSVYDPALQVIAAATRWSLTLILGLALAAWLATLALLRDTRSRIASLLEER